MGFDVVVVGGGPGAASAARDLAAQRLQVGLYEKGRFPREKPCGGCLSLKIDRILEPDWCMTAVAHTSVPMPGGMATIVVPRKCCTVDDRSAACLPVGVSAER